jgi:hypothetical protein
MKGTRTSPSFHTTSISGDETLSGYNLLAFLLAEKEYIPETVTEKIAKEP